MKIWYDCEFIECPGKLDLISIGMVDEYDNELYCECSEFNEEDACDWVKENVIKKLGPEDQRLTRKEIKQKILAFVGDEIPEWWGYCSGYDHVALSQIFGTMVELPEDWPYYTRDVKQVLDTCEWEKKDFVSPSDDESHNALFDAKWTKELSEKINDRLIKEMKNDNR